MGVIVNRMVEDSVLDRAYAALGDPTRRRLLETLRAGDARITDLAAPLPMTFAGGPPPHRGAGVRRPGAAGGARPRALAVAAARRPVGSPAVDGRADRI